MNTAPSASLENVFSFLELSDMPHVALVCKEWNEVLKNADWLWQKHAAGVPRWSDSIPEVLGRSGFRIFSNWKNGLAEVTPFAPSYKKLGSFTILPSWMRAHRLKFSMIPKMILAAPHSKCG